MPSPLGQNLALAVQSGLTMIYSGTTDPSVTALEAIPGTLFLGNGGAISGKAWVKQDSGLSTNWAPVSAGSSGGGGAGIAACTFFVDMNRTDTYVANGSIAEPFKTIQAAINAVAARGDNSPTKAYSICIVGPGIYPEALDLTSAALFSLGISFIGGAGANRQAAIVNSINATSGTLVNLWIQGLNTIGSVTVALSAVGATCNMHTSSMSGNLVVTSTSQMDMTDCQISGSVTVQSNAVLFYNDGSQGIFGALNALTGGTIVVQATSLLGSAATIDATSAVVLRSGVRANSMNWNVSGLLQAALARFGGTVTINAGGTFINQGSFIPANRVANAGTYTQSTEASMFGYTPTVGGNWPAPAPSDIKAALDELAARVVILSSNASVGGGATEALAVAGLLATDVIQAVSQKTAGANNTALTNFGAPGAGSLTVGWTGDPGAGSVVLVTVKRL